MDQNQTINEKVHNLIILDESGSMGSIRNSIINGFNEIVKNIKELKEENPHQKHSISFVSFNTLGQQELHFMEDVNSLKELNAETYSPAGGTPLFDAMGFSLTKLDKAITSQDNVHVFVSILTDGEENASQEFSSPAIKKLVESLKGKNWTFTYIGADHDVEKMAENLSINNHMAFDKSEAGMGKMFAKEKSARSMYMASSSKAHFSIGNIFKEEDDLDLNQVIPPTQTTNKKITIPTTVNNKSFWKKLTGK
jgi:Mg-chelatase subunit ChlD